MFLFTFEGKPHRLEFERKHEQVSVYVNGTVVTEKSKYPFTTARLLQLTANALPLRIASAKVGCLPTDHFSKEKGRLEALALLSKNLKKLLNSESGKLLNAAMWDCYLNRGKKITVVNITGNTNVEPRNAEATA